MKYKTVFTVFAIAAVLGFGYASHLNAHCNATHLRTNVLTVRDFVLEINKDDCLERVITQVQKGERPTCSEVVRFSLEPNARFAKTPSFIAISKSSIIHSQIKWSDERQKYVMTLSASGAWSLLQRESGVSFVDAFREFIHREENFYVRAEVISRLPMNHELASN